MKNRVHRQTDQTQRPDEHESELAEKPKSAPDEDKKPSIIIRAPQEEF